MTPTAPADRLAALLSAIRRKKQGAPGADALTARFGSLGRVLEADVEPLTLCGLSESEALLLHTLPAVARRCALEPFGASPALAGDANRERYVRALYTGVTREKLYLLCLDGRGRLIGRSLIGEGSDAALTFQPRLLVLTAIRSGARQALLCHNHPHGRAAFSEADRRATREAKELLSAIGVTLADHLLSADGRVLSLRRAGPEGRAVFDGRE